MRPVTGFDHSEVLCNKVLLSIKERKLLKQTSEGGRKSASFYQFQQAVLCLLESYQSDKRHTARLTEVYQAPLLQYAFLRQDGMRCVIPQPENNWYEYWFVELFLNLFSSYFSNLSPRFEKRNKVSFRWNHFEERQIPKQIVSLTQLKTNISMRKMHWLAQGWRKVQVEPGVVMATQNFKRKKKSDTCTLFPRAA